MSEYSATIIRDAGALTEIARAWEALWSRVPGTTPFQSPLWLIPWWHAFAPGALFVITAWRGTRLVGLAPLYLETGSLGRRLLPLGISVSDYLDVLIDPEWFEPAARILASQLTAADASWEVCELSELAPEANALRLPCPANWPDAIDASQSCPVLKLPDSVGELRSVLPPRKMRNLRMAWNRAARRGRASITRADRDGVASLLGKLIRLHQIRWESRGESGVLADSRGRRFHRHAVAGLSNAGLARLYALEIGSRTVGVYYGFLHAGRAFAYLHGFDPAYEFESPGTILIGHAIEEAIREGAREFHFLRGREVYKYGWGATDRWNRVRTFRRAEAFADVS
jgi:CelD/BcsL family acetyltransferase involved in cellulose biosynthesis